MLSDPLSIEVLEVERNVWVSVKVSLHVCVCLVLFLLLLLICPFHGFSCLILFLDLIVPVSSFSSLFPFFSLSSLPLHPLGKRTILSFFPSHMA